MWFNIAVSESSLITESVIQMCDWQCQPRIVKNARAHYYYGAWFQSHHPHRLHYLQHPHLCILVHTESVEGFLILRKRRLRALECIVRYSYSTQAERRIFPSRTWVPLTWWTCGVVKVVLVQWWNAWLGKGSPRPASHDADIISQVLHLKSKKAILGVCLLAIAEVREGSEGEQEHQQAGVEWQHHSHPLPTHQTNPTAVKVQRRRRACHGAWSCPTKYIPSHTMGMIGVHLRNPFQPLPLCRDDGTSEPQWFSE